MLKILLLFLLAFVVTYEAYAQEQIFTTYDHTTKGIVFDGKWTQQVEWKPTAFDQVKDGNESFVIRTGHDYENLYVMINYVTDNSIERNSDKAIICFDGKSEKSKTPDSNDYCFLLRVGANTPITLEGGNKIPNKNFFKVISNHPDLIGAADVSDDNDRYSKIPHPVYEYKIPLEIFGKSDHYGFYVGVYDDKTKEWKSWPNNIIPEKYSYIPSPELWGEIISPDKSIPEFEYVLLAILPAFTVMILISRVKSNKISGFN